MAEPIIEAPIPDNNNYKKRVVPKQIISFDEEENVLSSSVPSSSSSITSDTNSSNEVQSTSEKCGTKIDKTSESDDKIEKIKRKLSMETSGSRDKFQNSIDGPLTPIQSNIGELTPVSVEMNTESPEISETLSKDIPIDICTVFTEIDRKNQEFVKLNDKIIAEIERKNQELVKLNDKIISMNKENVILKEQLKKYVGAVQML